MQEITTFLSLEAEYVSISSVVPQDIWRRIIIKELSFVPPSPIVIDCDKSTISITRNLEFYGRTKHTELCHHCIIDQVL